MSHKRKYPNSCQGATALALSELGRLADARVAERGRAFFKKADVVPLYGVKAAAVHGLVREIHDSVNHTWDDAHAVEFCNTMVRRPELEAKLTGLLLLGRFQKRFQPDLLDVVGSWLAEDRLSSWAAVDGLCAAVTSPLLRAHPGLLQPIVRWAQGASRWQRRAAVVTLVPLARRGQYLAEAYGLANRLAGDPEDLIHKACGWLLREAGTTDRECLIQYLERRGHRLPRTTVRYAIERLDRSVRRRLLDVTRSDGAQRGR